MERFQQILDDMLVGVYYNLLRLEESALKKGKLELTINEMHLIEQVGKAGETGLTIREIAGRLGIKSPSVTVAVKKLEGKGFVVKEPCSKDGRVVNVYLTKQGKLVDAYHKYYRRVLTKTIAEGMSDSEKDVLLRAIQKINTYFEQTIKQASAESSGMGSALNPSG